MLFEYFVSSSVYYGSLLCTLEGGSRVVIQDRRAQRRQRRILCERLL